MTRSLEIEHVREGGEHRVLIRGQLDEKAHLVPIADEVGQRVTIDLEHVSFVNSLGLRAWIRLLLALSDRDTEVTFTRCSEAMVHQMNMVVAAKAGAQVDSFFVPYDCPTCGHGASMCLEVADHREALRAMQLPSQACPECDAAMECAELPERYLLFLELD